MKAASVAALTARGEEIRKLFTSIIPQIMEEHKMDEHYFMNVINALGQKIDTLEFMADEYKREAEKLSEENVKLRMRIAELERING